MSTIQPWNLPTITAAESHLQNPSSTPFLLQNLINGSFSPHPSESYIDSYNPKTGQVFARVCDTSAEQVNEAVEAADPAFASWSATPPSTRSKYLLRVADLIEERKELFAVWESIDQGKTLARARAEVERAVSNFRYILFFFFPPIRLRVKLKNIGISQHIFSTKAQVPDGQMTISSPTSIAHPLVSSF